MWALASVQKGWPAREALDSSFWPEPQGNIGALDFETRPTLFVLVALICPTGYFFVPFPPLHHEVCKGKAGLRPGTWKDLGGEGAVPSTALHRALDVLICQRGALRPRVQRAPVRPLKGPIWVWGVLGTRASTR